MATIRNTTSNTLLSGTSGNDFIQNGGWWDDSSHDGGSNVTINTGDGDDYVYNDESSNVTINTGAGNDEVDNDGSNVTINTGAGNDSIYNHGSSNVTINTGDGKDYVDSSGNSVTINTGAGNDSVFNDYGNGVTINTGAGNDSVFNGCYREADGSIYYYEDDDVKNVVFQYSSGDGNDIIYGFKADSTLQIGNGYGTFSKDTVGNDVVVTVGKGKISLIGAASLSAVNIVRDKNPATKWTLDGTTATYGDLVIKGVKSLDGISLSGSTVTISKASLGTSKVTISDGYTLKLADDVSESTAKQSWSISGTKATYKQTTTAGYTLADNVITYTKKATKTLTTVSGVKSTKGLSVDGKVVTVSKASLGTSKVTISDGYTLALADDVDNATTKTAWSLSNSTATYKQTKTAGYALADNVITYTKKATKTLATVSGVKSTKGLSVDGKVVTVSKASLGTRECW